MHLVYLQTMSQCPSVASEAAILGTGGGGGRKRPTARPRKEEENNFVAVKNLPNVNRKVGDNKGNIYQGNFWVVGFDFQIGNN